jgi:hypothetical protein
MPRSAASIQAQIDVLEAEQLTAVQSITSDNTGVVKAAYDVRQKILNELYGQLQRLSRGSMFARTRVKNIGGI